MSCPDCDTATLNMDNYTYRWKNGTIIMIGCRTHIREIMDVLNKHSESTEPDEKK